MDTKPQSFQDEILKYLKEQEDYPECTKESVTILGKSASAEITVRAILEDLILTIESLKICQDTYQDVKKLHNQYYLFDLNDLILDFKIDENMFSQLTFRENLIISYLEDTTPVPVGGLCVDVQRATGHQPKKLIPSPDDKFYEKVIDICGRIRQGAADTEEDLQQKLNEYEEFLKNEMKTDQTKFLVHLSTQFSINDQNAGSRITAWVDKELHTLEERRTEYVVDNKGAVTEKSIYVALQRDRYYMKHKSSPEKLENRNFYNMARTKDMVCEGASLILMRYLAITRYEGTFELSTVYINGDMCRNIYECTKAETNKVNDKNLPTCKIYRTIIEECGIVHRCVTELTTYGQIIRQEWEGCDCIIHINPLAYLHYNRANKYDRLVLSKTWEQDLELLSKYTDFKTNAELEIKAYVSEHPEIKDMIADYVSQIILLKPEDVLQFTLEFFRSFEPYTIARTGFFESRDKYENILNDDNIKS